MNEQHFRNLKETSSVDLNSYTIINTPAKGTLKDNKPLKIKLGNLLTALGIGTSTSPYKVYSALMTQSGTNAPTVTILQNTIGNISWKRTSTGFYEGVLSNAFINNKTFTLIQKPFIVNEGGGVYVSCDVAILRETSSKIGIWTERYDSVANKDYLNDSILSETAIEIRVYN